MKFVNPAFLIALSAIAIPIIIHLFNFRRFKKIYFTNVRFLRDVQQETQSRSRLKHLLVLAARILAVAFLVMSFAQPYIPANDTKVVAGDKAISIYLDNSFSMEALGKSGSLFEEARKRAEEIAMAHKATDRFQILTNDFEARHQRLMSREEFIEALDGVKASPSFRPISEIISRQLDLLKNSEARQKKSFIVSDFQKSICDFPNLKNDTNILVNFVPLISQDKNNVYIDSCWFETPVRQLNKTENLHVRIRNSSQNNIENSSIKLFINGKQRTPASFSIQAGAMKDFVLSFASREIGIQNCYVEITDYPISFDDRFYFSFEVAKNIPVLCIGRSGKDMHFGESPNYLNSLFSGDSLFIYSEVKEDKIDYSLILRQKLIILNELKAVSSGLSQELKRFVFTGGSLFVFPHPEVEISSYRDFFLQLNIQSYVRMDSVDTKVDKINYDQEIYAETFVKQSGNIDLPIVYNSYLIPKNTRSSEDVLLRMQNGSSFLSRYLYEKGIVYLSAVPLNTSSSNFAKHAVFVPTLYNAAMFAQTRQKMFYTIGKNNSIEITGTELTGDKVFHLKGKKENFDIIPEYRLIDSRINVLLHNQLKDAGNYVFNDAKQDISGLSFNFDRKESDMQSFNRDELIAGTEKAGLVNVKLLDTEQGSLKDTLMEIDQGNKLYKWCLLFTLLFLATEVVLLRFWRA